MVEGQVRRCHRCGAVKPLVDFYRNAKDRTHGRAWECKTCTKARSAARAKELREELRPATRRYSREAQRRLRARQLGLSPDDLAEATRAQEGRCAICGDPEVGRELCMDHDHKTGVFRALLCSPCNKGLGNFRDDPERLRAAADYLISHLSGALR